MLTLITGQPGNGKTLYTMMAVEKLRKETNRPVYYWNIGGVTYDWNALGDKETFDRKGDGIEPDISAVTRWWDCPQGSIIVIDEAQGLYRPRPKGGQPPEYLTQIETHRKGGYDLFFMTQHPQLIDMPVRKLAGRHIEVRRRFGMQHATLYQWEECKDPSSDRDLKLALKTKFFYPKEVFGSYRSAQVHTVKRDFPIRKLVVIGGLLVVVVGLLYSVVYKAFHAGDKYQTDGQQLGEVSANPPGQVQIAGVRGGASYWDPAARAARVDGMPDSAPMFDNLQVVRSMPVPVGCGSLVDDAGIVLECKCYSDQGTRIEMGVELCMRHLEDGVYDPRKPPAPIVTASTTPPGMQESPAMIGNTSQVADTVFSATK